MHEYYESCLRRLEWAGANIDKLERRVGVFLGGCYTTRGYVDPQTGDVVVECEEVKPIPDEFGLRIGDILHNLRAVLDNLVWALIVKNGHVPRDHVKFHIVEKDNSDSRSSIVHYAEGCTPDQVEAIKSLQPYNFNTVADSSILTLHRLNNIDKHRTLHIVKAVTEPGTRVQFSSDSIGHTVTYFHHTELVSGAELVRVHPSSNGSARHASYTPAALLTFGSRADAFEGLRVSDLGRFHAFIQNDVIRDSGLCDTFH